MRVSINEDEDYPGQFELWQANCKRSCRGRKGRAVLRELENALLALPEPKLGYDVLVESTGEVCAIGSLMVQRKVDAGMSREQAIAECSTADPYETEETGVELGMPSLVAWSAAVENDEYSTETPEERHARMLKWVRSHLRSES